MTKPIVASWVIKFSHSSFSIYLLNPTHHSYVFDIANEVCNLDDSDTTLGHSDDVWDTILSLTRKSAPSLRKSLEPPRQDTPHSWQDHNKHLALSNLLSVAVSHKDLLLRKAYIERIMGLSTQTQRLLMALIERRKKITGSGSNSRSGRSKTPSKKDRRVSSAAGAATKATQQQQQQQNTTEDNITASSIGPPASDKVNENELTESTKGTATVKPTSKDEPNGRDNNDNRNNTNELHSQGNNTTTLQSPFRLRRFNSANKNVKSSEPNSTTKSKRGGFLSTPNFLRRGNHETIDPDNDSETDGTRRSFHDAFGSPLQQPVVKRVPPPSSERSLQSSRSVFTSPGLGGADAEYENMVQGMRDEIEDLKQKLNSSRKKEDYLSQSIYEKEAVFKKELIKVEREARDRHDDTKEAFEKQVAELQSKLVQVTEECVKAHNERDELAKLQDEIDVMEHTKAQLEETQERLNAYKEKVHQLVDVKSALKEEEEAHSRCVDDNLKLRNEVQSLLPLRRQLEQYQTRLADAEVRITNYQDELEKVKDQKVVSSDVNVHMEQYVLAQEEELQELRRRVRLGEVASQSKDSISFIGEGMSELNPQLKEELMSLRNENEQLRIFRAKRGDDEVIKLEQEVGDKTRLADRYKTQFLSTKDQLEATQSSLQESRGREAKLRNDLAESMTKIQDTQQEVEDLSGQLYKATEDLNASQLRESKLEEELASWASEAKNLQEHANDLSRRLKKNECELDESLNREANLLSEVERINLELQESTEQGDSLAEKLKELTLQFQESQQREKGLAESVAEWTNRAQQSHSHAEDVSAQLIQSNKDLETAREEGSKLESELAELTTLKEYVDDQAAKLSQDLTNTALMLEESRQAIQKAVQREDVLRNEVADLTCRADDAERVSKQRMELVQSTREKVQSAEIKIEILEQDNAKMVEALTSWTSRAEAAEENATDLDAELEEIRRALNDTEEKLAESQALADHLKVEVQTLSVDRDDWREKATDARNIANRLQDEVDETREHLQRFQDQVVDLEAREKELKVHLEYAETTLFDLEGEIESQVAAREEVTANLKELESRHAQLSQESQTRQEQLIAELASKQVENNKLKLELDSTKESLAAMQVTLGSFQHREKMLKHDITKLKDKNQQMETELAKARQEMEDAVEESSKSVESIRELLMAKSQKELEEVQQNMNQLLEDERKAKRHVDELYREQISQIRQKHEQQLERIQQDGKETIEKHQKEHELEIHRMKGEHEDRMVDLKKTAQEEKSKFMEQGKGMLKEHKETIQNLTDDVAFLEGKILELEEEKKKQKDSNERVGKQFQHKMVEYKKKLHDAAARNKALSSNLDDADDKIKLLTREKFKLSEENDRYRRQLGGRTGTDSVLQSQLEAVQKELHDADEENKELKRKIQSGGHSSLSSISEESTGYSLRSGSKQSTLAQQRADYEETIVSLKSEMRGHVMEKTALITASQAEAKRAWQAEQQISELKQETTSLKLTIARLENLLTTEDDNSYKKVTFTDYSDIPRPPSDLKDDVGDVGGATQRAASPSILRNKPATLRGPGAVEKHAMPSNANTSFGSGSGSVGSERSLKSLNSEPNFDWM